MRIPTPVDDFFGDERSIRIKEILDRRTSINSETGCWEFLSTSGTGYGHLTIDRVYYQVHRLSAELFLGYIPSPDLWVLHKCNNKCCWNPAHLYIGTPQENSRQREEDGRGRTGKLQTHCNRGHEFTTENTYVNPSSGYRQCKICKDEMQKQWRERKFGSH